MKTESFIAGAVLGAVAAVAVSKKFFGGKCPVCGESGAAEGTGGAGAEAGAGAADGQAAP